MQLQPVQHPESDAQRRSACLMPSGLPPPELLTSRKIGAFTLDTSVLRAAGFHFEHGALRQLAHQLPPWLSLWMSSVVVREVARQRLAAVQGAAEQARQAWSNLHRHLDRPPEGGSLQTEVGRLEASAAERFDGQMERLLTAHAGEVVQLRGESLIQELFDAYFHGAPPFAGGSKKSEFPDGAALLSLDAAAAERGIYVLAVSHDEGWHEYCATSRRIYCLRKLADLAGLFRSTGSQARAVVKSLSAYLKGPRAAHELGLAAVIRDGLRNVVIDTVIPPIIRKNVDAVVTEVRLSSFHVEADSVGIWLTSSADGRGAAEVAIECTVELQLGFYDPWQPRPSEWTLHFDDESACAVRSLELSLALELAELDTNPQFPDAVSSVSLVPLDYKLRLTKDEVPSQYVPFSASWDDSDDLPF